GNVHAVNPSVLIFLGFSVIPVLHRPVVAGDPAVNLRGFSAGGAGKMFPGNVAVIPADRVGGGQRRIGKLIVFRDGRHQGGGGFPVRQLFSQERVEHRTGGIKGLHLILNVQGGKNIFREIHRQVGAVGVIGSLPLFSGRFDLRPFSPVVLGQPVAGGFR